MNIKLSPKDKKYIGSVDDVYAIMQRILLRENKIDRDKEHFWIIGMNEAGFILYIELVTLGTVKAALIEPMNVYRVAVMKNATRVIAIHNHPSGAVIPSEDDKNITDRLIQVGKILNIEMVDHLIISPTTYTSFAVMGFMTELNQSIKYVPTYQLIEKIRKEEKAIAREAVKTERDLRKKSEQEKEKIMFSAANFLFKKGMNIEQAAKILEVTPEAIEKITSKKQ